MCTTQHLTGGMGCAYDGTTRTDDYSLGNDFCGGGWRGGDLDLRVLDRQGLKQRGDTMSRILIDLGSSTVGALSEMPKKGMYGLSIYDSGSIDDGAYTPPAHIWLFGDSLKNLYMALHKVYGVDKPQQESGVANT